MQIGILTFFRNPNYGAMLQAYALWQFLAKRGHRVKFIDYDFGNASKPSLTYCNLSKSFRTLRIKWQQRINFDIARFAETFPKTTSVATPQSFLTVSKTFDAVIVGSDQVWNPEGVASKHTSVVFLAEVQKPTKKIAYSPSFSVGTWPSGIANDVISHALSDFDALSVRESEGIKIIQALGVRNVELVVDPTLLFTRSFYDNLLGDKQQNTADYLLNFLIRDWASGQREANVLNKLKAITNCAAILDDTDKSTCKTSFMGLVLHLRKKVSVHEWLRRIREAKFVLTNSFHGTVFCLLFHRPFLCMTITGEHRGMNVRIVSLLQSTGLQNRLIDIEQPFVDIEALYTQEINWNDVDTRLEQLRKKSILFLENALTP